MKFRQVLLSVLQVVYEIVAFTLSIVGGFIFLFHPRGRQRWLERYGCWEPLPSKDFLWMHGASVGEIQGLLPLAAELRKQLPEVTILFTATSPTGLARLPEGVVGRLLPFDSQVWIRRALRGRAPRCAIFTETELWPGVLSFLSRGGVPFAFVNSRMRSSAFQRYRWFRAVWKSLFASVGVVCSSSESAAERLRQLGMPQDRIVVTGNTKYDREPSIHSVEEAVRLRQVYFGRLQGPVVALASVHPGEEHYFISAMKKWRDQACFLVAPRHLERLREFEASFQHHGIAFCKKSELRGREGQFRVVVLDSVGELEPALSFCAAAFVGGSLVPVGGHNPLEAAAYGLKVAMGPATEVVQEVVEELLAAGVFATIPLGSSKAAEAFIDRAVSEFREYQGESDRPSARAARGVARRYQGATKRTVAAVLPLLRGKE